MFVSCDAVADPGGEGGRGPPHLVKISHKKMAPEGGLIDFMFLAPPYPAAGSACVCVCVCVCVCLVIDVCTSKGPFFKTSL